MMVRTLSTAPFLAMALVGAMALVHAGSTDAISQESRGISKRQESAMKIHINVEGTIVTATLVDNETSRDFVSLLPLTLTLKDYAETEKISDLPRRLSTKGAPAGSKPSTGDITYYAPWGNLAIFHKDFSYSKGLIRLGSIVSGIEALRRPGTMKVQIERGQ